jgi:phosphoglycerate kinase
MLDLDLHNKRVLIREDFNVPMQGENITSDARIQAALPTIHYALQSGARLMLMSHLGRPTEGRYDATYSLAPIAKRLAKLLDRPVPLLPLGQESCLTEPGSIVLWENVRFHKGEKSNDAALAKRMASCCDIFVMDAFATAHRREASTYGIAEFAPKACAGPLLVAELEALGKVMHHPKRPLLAIVGGAKVSTKLLLLENLLQLSDYLIVGGGIANTFMAAKKMPIGNSLYEAELLAKAGHLLDTYADKIILPNDVVVAKQFSADASATVKSTAAVDNDDMILDVGPETSQHFAQVIQKAKTLLWNGPVGVFELPQFATGTEALATAIAQTSAFTIAGGGDTLAAIEKYKINEHISYISTGGGAFLEFIEGKKLPAVAILEQRAQLDTDNN